MFDHLIEIGRLIEPKTLGPERSKGRKGRKQAISFLGDIRSRLWDDLKPREAEDFGLATIPGSPLGQLTPRIARVPI